MSCHRKYPAVVGNKMTRLTVLILLSTFIVSCKTTIETFQTSEPNKIGVKSNKFRGTIFKNTYSFDQLCIPPADTLNRFTPTKSNIELAETILKNQIKSVNRNHVNQFGKRDNIDKHLNKYFRQYVGFINEKGDSIIHINFQWDRFTLFDRIKGYWDDRLDYTSDFSIVFDGGSRYWNVNVNLTSKKMFGLSVNGVV
jgi:hypothetical protein